FPFGSSVTLRATPTGQSFFSGWSASGCAATSTTCVVTMTQPISVGVAFTPPIGAPPTLVLSTKTLTFNVSHGNGTTPDRVVTITSADGEPLAPTTQESPVIRVPQNDGWLKVTPGGLYVLHVSVQPLSLEPGTYTETIPIIMPFATSNELSLT